MLSGAFYLFIAVSSVLLYTQTMSFSAHSIANQFIKLAKKEAKQLTNMQLQKLVFIANGYSLVLLERPLFYHNSHAWQFGPVIPKLYKTLQKYGSGFVSDFLPLPDPNETAISEDSEEYELIVGVWGAYGHLTGSQLSGLTHKEGTPWSETWSKSKFAVIDNELIANHYKGLVESA